MDEFWQELTSGELHFRDIWQFEVKSDYTPVRTGKTNIYTQEFYFFVPNSLQINTETYSKEQFYQDQTNLIRYKTPEFTFAELIDEHNERSPLTKIKALKDESPTLENLEIVKDELKLLANIVRSALRKEVKDMIQEVDRPSSREDSTLFKHHVETFCHNINVMHSQYLELERHYQAAWNNPDVNHHFLYIDEFISSSINFYLSGLLEHVRNYQAKGLHQVDKELCNVLVKEKLHRERQHQEPRKINERSVQSEFILYRTGLLNKFVIDALLLDTTRTSLQRRWGNIIGSFAAGFAMLIYLLLFIWQGQIFVITSAPFIILTVVAYIIKDRLKESLKSLSYQKAFKLFSDYTTHIKSPDTNLILGDIKESYSFLDENSLPRDIVETRNHGFHNVLEAFKRPEQVLYYKKELRIFPQVGKEDPRKSALNVIFRFNIHQFLTKASDPYDFYLTLDPETLKLNRTLLPKVYHINIIMKTTFNLEGEAPTVEIKKMRLIIDKEGIKHIDQVT